MQTHVDGVVVHHEQLEGPLRACLVFRAGLVDEEAWTHGLSALVMYAAVHAGGADRPFGEVESAVMTTSVTFTGSPEGVAARLESVCQALSELAAGTASPDLVAAAKRRLLSSSGSEPQHVVLAEHAGHRWGRRGAGLELYPPMFVAGFTAAQVQQRALEHFGAGNAVLILSGPVPEGLRLPLPDGGPRPAPPARPLPRPLPAEEVSLFDDGASLSFLVPDAGVPDPTDGAAQSVVMLTVERRAQIALAAVPGWDGAVTVDVVGAGGQDGVLVAAVNCRPAASAACVRAVLGILREIRESGVSEEEHALAAETQAEVFAGEGEWERLEARATAAMCRWAPFDEKARERVRTVTHADLRRQLAGLEDSLIVSLPAEAYPDAAFGGSDSRAGLVVRAEAGPGPGLAPSAGEKPAGEEFGPTLRARLSGLKLRFIVGDAGVVLRSPVGDVCLAWDDVVMWEIGVDDVGVEVVSVMGVDGTGGDIPVGLMREGDRLRELLLARLPAERRIPDPA